MIRVFGVVRESIVDGPGLRFVVFTQGCPHACPGCHNPESHDPLGGYEVEPSRILEEFSKNPLLKGMTFSGGEPMAQPDALLPLAEAVVAMGKDLVIFSGYTFEELLAMGEHTPSVLKLLSMTSLLIDGPFMEAQKDLTLTFRGSHNQRLINPKESLAAGRMIEVSL